MIAAFDAGIKAVTSLPPTFTLTSPVSTPDTPDAEDECRDMRCSQINGRCVGYHCPRCGEPCSYQGHGCRPGSEDNNPSPVAEDERDTAIGQIRNQALRVILDGLSAWSDRIRPDHPYVPSWLASETVDKLDEAGLLCPAVATSEQAVQRAKQAIRATREWQAGVAFGVPDTGLDQHAEALARAALRAAQGGGGR